MSCNECIKKFDKKSDEIVKLKAIIELKNDEIDGLRKLIEIYRPKEVKIKTPFLDLVTTVDLSLYDLGEVPMSKLKYIGHP